MSEREIFQLLHLRWDVTRAKQIAADLPAQRFDPAPCFAMLSLIRLDEDHVPAADLDCPLIAVRVREADGAAMVIDGWHRVARAQREGVTSLPIVVLDEDQERQVRISGVVPATGPNDT